MSGILAIIHPAQYDMAYKIKMRLMESSDCENTLRKWGTVYTAATVIANRRTPYHRDNGSRVEWYDMLTSYGPYDKAPFHLEPLGLRINNPPGTICAFSGRAIRHGVRKIEQPRISLALYLRDNVRDGADVDSAGWMTQQSFEPLVGPKRGSLRPCKHQVSSEVMAELVKGLRDAKISK